MNARTILSASVFVIAWAPFAVGATYSGSLSSSLGEIEGLQEWIDPGQTTIAWEITDVTTHFHYKYTLSVPPAEKDISHFIIEVSTQFDDDNFWNESGPFAGTEVNDFSQANGSPSIPEGTHGLKFDDMSGTMVVIEFDSDRRPVWGDFYAKGGGDATNEAWNEGFSRTDPLDDPGDGSIDNHILVPDSVLPEPGTLALLMVGGPMLMRRLRRRGT